MSGTITIDEDTVNGGPNRRSDEPSVTMEVGEVERDERDPSDDARRLADDQAAQINSMRAEREAIMRQAADANRRAQEAIDRSQRDRVAALAAEKDAAKVMRDSAVAALETARETGSIKDEVTATELLAAATARLARLEDTSTDAPAPAASDAGPRAVPNEGPRVSAETQRWIDANPAFMTDRMFRGAAAGAHEQAIADGIRPDTPAYFRFVEDNLVRMGFKVAGREGGRQSGNGNGAMKQGFGGASPSSASSGNGGGTQTVRTPLGPMQITPNSRGGIGIRLQPHLEADFKEAARICGMSLQDYCFDQYKIAQETERGGNTGLIIGPGR